MHERCIYALPFTKMHHMITVPDEWIPLPPELSGSVVYVTGATDRGKSTLCRHLVGECIPHGPVALLDCDTGQSTIGPPTTLGLAAFSQDPATPDSVHLRFAGSTSPRGHFLEFLTGTRRLLDTARASPAVTTVIDSPGFIEGPAALEFQFQLIDLLQPDHIIALQKHRELEPVLANFTRHPGVSIHRLAPAPGVRIRSVTERHAYRKKQFLAYFSAAGTTALSLSGLGVHGRIPPTFRREAWQNLLIALCTYDQLVLSLGIVADLDLAHHTISVFSPPFASADLASIHVGTMTLEGFIPELQP
jgi:polynucleotide 5'-hydroxyl-kinase GRC3/NOL9